MHVVADALVDTVELLVPEEVQFGDDSDQDARPDPVVADLHPRRRQSPGRHDVGGEPGCLQGHLDVDEIVDVAISEEQWHG